MTVTVYSVELASRPKYRAGCSERDTQAEAEADLARLVTGLGALEKVEHLRHVLKVVVRERDDAHADVIRLRNAIAVHHAQKAADRCWMDDDVLYAACGLPPVDRRVGDEAVASLNSNVASPGT